jgi:hypothetical protein
LIYAVRKAEFRYQVTANIRQVTHATERLSRRVIIAGCGSRAISALLKNRCRRYG